MEELTVKVDNTSRVDVVKVFLTGLLFVLVFVPVSTASAQEWSGMAEAFVATPRVSVRIDPSSLQSLDQALANKGIGNVMMSDLKTKFVTEPRTINGKQLNVISAQPAGGGAGRSISLSTSQQPSMHMTMPLMQLLRDVTKSRNTDGIALDLQGQRYFLKHSELSVLTKELLNHDVFKRQLAKLDAQNKPARPKTGHPAPSQPSKPQAAYQVKPAGPLKIYEGENPNGISVRLQSDGGRKIAVIKALRKLTSYGLRDTKNLVDAAPTEIAKNLSAEQAEQWKQALMQAGAIVD